MLQKIDLTLNSKNLDRKIVDKIKEKIEDEREFPVKNYTDSFFRRRILVTMGKLKIKELKDFLNAINDSEDNLTLLVKELSINVTQFFRNQSLWNYLEKELFPKILKNKIEKKEFLKIWIAGTATGQEPYSIAILIDNILKKDIRNLKIEISGVDLSEKALIRLRKGIYVENELEGVSQNIKEQYFKNVGLNEDGYIQYQIIDEIRQMVSVKKMDLFSGEFPKERDVIFCRNVVIYFNKEHKRILFKKFIDSLRIGGYLIIGMSETMPMVFKNLVYMTKLKQRVYQKKEPNKIYKKRREGLRNNSNGDDKFTEFSELYDEKIEIERQSKYDPYQKKIVDLFCNTIIRFVEIKESVLRGFIIRSFREWKENNNITTKDFLELSPKKQINTVNEIYSILKIQLKRVRKGEIYEEIIKGIDSAKEYYKKYLEL